MQKKLLTKNSSLKTTEAVPIAWIDYLLTFGFIFAAFLIGAVLLWLGSYNRTLATLWALACMISGTIIGFLFGIPRVLQKDAALIPQEPSAEAKPVPSKLQSAYRQQVNTNLEQISDWLTKIIVGIGLIELRRLPEFLNRSSAFIANGLGATGDNQPVAAAIIIYFGIIGFLGGYTVTRIYLAGAFKRADTGESGFLQVGGKDLNLEEALQQQGYLLKDLLDQNANIKADPVQEHTTLMKQNEKITSGKIAAVKSVLWVDDKPRNNSYLIDLLKSKQIEVTESESTEDAMKILRERSFDRLITDMGRKEGAAYVETAGINLIKKVREIKSSIPIIVYCSAEAAVKFKQQALAAGADDITASPSFLINALKLDS